MNTPSVVMDRLRDPKERAALTWLAVMSVPVWLYLVAIVGFTFGIALLVVGLILLLRWMMDLFAEAYFKTNGVRVSQTQLPELHQVVKLCADRLGIEPPEVYVMQANVWNALAMKLGRRRLVVLLSGTIDSLLLKGDMQQLAWVVGHEIGHHAAGHFDFWRKCAQLGGWCVWVMLWYQRRGELTCDRVGLYCCGNLKASTLALANATVGAQLADKVDVDEAIRQWRLHRDEFFVRYRTVYSTHPHHLWRLAELRNAAKALGIPDAPVAEPSLAGEWA